MRRAIAALHALRPIHWAMVAPALALLLVFLLRLGHLLDRLFKRALGAFEQAVDGIFMHILPLLRIARGLWQTGDATIIDGVPNGLASLTGGGSRQIVKLQTGSLAVYAFVMLIGVVLLVGLFMLIR